MNKTTATTFVGIRRISLLLFLLPSLAVAAGFNCSKAKTAAEQQICADSTLAMMDREMSDAYERLLASVGDADAWKADQRAWQVERNHCGGDDGCLRLQYAERLTMLRMGGRPFRWDSRWWRVASADIADNSAPAELVMSKVTAQGFEFSVEAWAGANVGRLSGKTSFVAAGVARYRGDATSGTEGCVLVFKRVLNRLEVKQTGFPLTTCGEGAHVHYDGIYVAAEHSPNIATDLISRRVLPSPKLDEEFRAMVGQDYGKFVDTADAVGMKTKATLNGKTVTIIRLFVTGIACWSQATIAFDGDGHIWATLLHTLDAGKAELRYYTNADADKGRLPELFEDERKECVGSAASLRMMP